jgi:hypothetical protein
MDSEFGRQYFILTEKWSPEGIKDTQKCYVSLFYTRYPRGEEETLECNLQLLPFSLDFIDQRKPCVIFIGLDG